MPDNPSEKKNGNEQIGTFILSLWINIFTSVSFELVTQAIYHPRDWSHKFISKDTKKTKLFIKSQLSKQSGF